MQDRKHALVLFTSAANNIKALQAMVQDTESFSDAIFGFQAQQAVEKLLKSWLSFSGIMYARTHDLELLIQQLKDAQCEVPESFNNLIDLNDFAVQFRYEVMDDEAIDRKSVCDQVELCVQYILKILDA